MKEKPTPEKPKKAYKKPVLRTIDLALEEVMALGCKTSGSPAYGVSICDVCYYVSS